MKPSTFVIGAAIQSLTSEELLHRYSVDNTGGKSKLIQESDRLGAWSAKDQTGSLSAATWAVSLAVSYLIQSCAAWTPRVAPMSSAPDQWSSPLDPRCLKGENGLESAHNYVYPLVSVFGILGNLCMLLTVRYSHLKESPYIYLTCIAIADIIFLLFTLSLKVVLCRTCQFTFETAYYLEYYYWFCYATVVYIMRSWHNFLMLSITIERFICVRWPMKTRSWCTRERAKKICIAAFLLSFSSESLKFSNAKISILFEVHPKEDSHFWITNFACAPNSNTTISENRYTCFSRNFPIHRQSNETHPECSQDLVRSMETASGFRNIPRTIHSQYTLHCLHQFCVLPQIREDLVFDYIRDDHIWGLLRTTHNNHTISILTKGGRDDLSPPREGLAGKAMYLNGNCNFILAPYGVSHVLETSDDHYTEQHTDVVKCPFHTIVKGDGWRRHFPRIYGRILLWIRALSTVLLTVSNVLVVYEVRRANRKATDSVLSNNRQNTSAKRRHEENRLTFSLISLSCVRILVDVVFIFTWDPIARYIYERVVPPGGPLRNHRTISDFLHVAEKSSIFYLLAFMNRKFSGEFVQQVVHGKFRMHQIMGTLQHITSICPLTTRAQQDVPTEPPPTLESGAGIRSKESAAASGGEAPPNPQP